MTFFVKRSSFIYFVYWTQMTYNKTTKTLKQYQADFSLNRKQRGLSFYVITEYLLKKEKYLHP